MKMLPAGAMVLLNVDAIDEGSLKKQMNQSLDNGHRELRRYREETGDSGGKVEITVKLTLEYDPDMQNHVVLTHGLETKVPKRTSKTFVKEVGETLLCQPAGSSRDDPDQQRLFDAKGNPIGVIDSERGFLPEPEIAGKVGGA